MTKMTRAAMTDEDMAFWIFWCIEEYAAEKTNLLAKSQKCLMKKVFFLILMKMRKFCIRGGFLYNSLFLHIAGFDFIITLIL